MSLESGRKLGITSSLIAVIIPIIYVALFGVLLISIFASIPLIANGSNHTIGSPLGSLGFFSVLIVALSILSFVGIILFIIAMHHLSQYFNEPSIYKNALYGFLINIAGGVIAMVVLLFLFVTTRLFSPSANSSSVAPIAVTFIVSFLTLFAVTFIVGVSAAVFYMRAFNQLGDKSGIHNFQNAGLLYLLGTVLAIVFVGGILIWVAWIFALSGFCSLKPKETETPAVASTYSTPQVTMRDSSSGDKKICSLCGAENRLDSYYCGSCGKKLN